MYGGATCVWKGLCHVCGGGCVVVCRGGCVVYGGGLCRAIEVGRSEARCIV